ncbi:DgyrCDS4272 [Dimorphilus gyrociliatus]|uniref:small monomeric GTPase n=1 Tax=Dimorphilus gyrociliatus TaxID=2664684 RepID=A0A7I8VH16_9ANNE|nr:DgyrCDS4272 [Dimorphilus gyrociliatus]
MLSWFREFLSKWLTNYFRDQKKTFVIIGLDYAGKTTLTGKIKTGRMIAANPSLRPNLEELRLGQLTFTVYDLGGHKLVRRVWREYCYAADGIIFVLDAADKERMNEAKSELHNILNDEEFSTIPILILGNKIDIVDAMGREELIGCLNIYKNIFQEGEKGVSRPIEIFSCSTKLDQGYGAGIRWLAKQVT